MPSFHEYFRAIIEKELASVSFGFDFRSSLVLLFHEYFRAFVESELVLISLSENLVFDSLSIFRKIFAVESFLTFGHILKRVKTVYIRFFLLKDVFDYLQPRL